MLKKTLSYLGFFSVVAIGIYAYYHFTEENVKDRFALDYLYPDADFILELNDSEQIEIKLKTLRNILPNECELNSEYKEILSSLEAEKFQKAYLASYNCERTCLLIESKQNLGNVEISDWSIQKASKNLWLVQDGAIPENSDKDYLALKSFLKPIENLRAIVKNENGIYQVHEIEKRDNYLHFKGFVLDSPERVSPGANIDFLSVSQLLPSESAAFFWQALTTESTSFKENELSEFIHFSTPKSGSEVSFTALRMKINNEEAQKTFKVANSSIGVIGNTKWMEDYIPRMNVCTHYSLFRDWIVCGSSKNDLEWFAKTIKKGDWRKNADFSSLQNKLGMNLNSLEYTKLDGGAMEMVQNVITTEGQHYNIIDILDAENALALEETLDKPEPIEPDDFELTEIADVVKNPFEFINHYTRETEWVVQDDDMNLILMNKNKEVIFKRKLDSQVMGDFKMVDALKNNKYQLLFNTEKYIYLIDRKGRDVENYPIALSTVASNELAVVDYDKNKNYRLLIGLDNGEVLNYTIDGKLVKGWKYEQTSKAVIYPVTHLRMGSKDYLFTLNEDYEIQLLDRRGQIRHPLDNQPKDLDNLAIEFFKENNIQDSGIRYISKGQEKEFVFGKASS